MMTLCENIELELAPMSCEFSLFKEYPWSESAVVNGGEFTPWEDGAETLGGTSSPWSIVPTVNGGDTGEYEPNLNIVVNY